MACRDDASTHTLALVVATVIIAATAAFALHQSRVEPAATAHAAELNAAAAGSLVTLLETWGAPPNWDLGEAPIDRLGVGRVENDARILDADKLDALRDLSAGGVPSEALRSGLGLDGFHIRLRVEPTFVPLPNGTVADLEPVRVAYVARYESGREATVAGLERAHVEATGAAFDPAEAETTPAHRGVGDRFPDDATTLRVELVPRLAGFEGADYDGASGSGESVWTVLDADAFVASVPDSATWWDALEVDRVLTPAKWSGDAASGFTLTRERTHSLTLGAFDLSAFAGGGATLEFTHWLAAGEQSPFADEASVAALCLSCASATEETVWSWASPAEVGARGAFVQESIDLTRFAGESVLLRLEYERNTIGGGVGVDGEGWFIGSVFVNGTARLGGDATSVYANVLDYSTTRYDALVVGSDVDHDAFGDADGVTATAVLEWLESGGGLLVLGSDEGAGAGWASPRLIGAGPALAAGRFSAGDSDISHPLVASPHAPQVAAADYADSAYRPAAGTVRVLAGTSEDGTVPLLFTRPPGGEFDGGAVFTSARPGHYQSATDAFHTFVNWLAYLARIEAQVEAGDGISPQLPFGFATAPAFLTDPRWGDDVLVEASMFVWN